MPTSHRIVRVFVSSPGDVKEERELAKQVIQSLRRRYAGSFQLVPVLWEDLPLTANCSFQQGIDLVLSSDEGIDIALFILWTRIGTPLGKAILKRNNREYLSGTEREWDLMNEASLQSLQQGKGELPQVVVYRREDDVSFHERMRGLKTDDCQKLLEQKKKVEDFIRIYLHDPVTGVNTRAYHLYARPVGFSILVRQHLTKLLDQLAGSMGGAPVWNIEEKGPPFLGLEAFEPQHADVFFGREQETLLARHALREQARKGCAFLLISGASGSGKSSLARAGVLPAVAEYELDEQVSEWRTVIVTPSELGKDPLASLLMRLTAREVLPQLLGESADIEALLDGMRKNPELTVRLRVTEAFAAASRERQGGVRIFLLMDQLEELFVAGAFDDVARKEFLSALEALSHSGHVWVLATVRSDFSQHVQTQPELVRMVEGQGLLPLLPPEADALHRLIEEPVRMAGLAFEETDGRSLSHVILTDAASHAELLPMLEFVLRELYERRDGMTLTSTVYRQLGGIEGAVAHRAEEVFKTLSPLAKDSVGAVLKALVSVGQDGDEGGGDQIVRQRVPRAELSALHGAEELVQAFVKDRLFITTVVRTGEPVITVAHECLLRVWPRAKMWAEQNRDFLRTRARIAARIREGAPLLDGDPLLDAARFHQLRDPDGFKPEQSAFIESSVHAAMTARRRREWLKYSIVSAAAVIVLSAITFYFSVQRRAQQQRERDATALHLAAVAERELTRKDYAQAEVASAKSLTASDSAATRDLLSAARSGGMKRIASSDDVLPDSSLTAFSRDGFFSASVMPGAQGGSSFDIAVCADGKKHWRFTLPSSFGQAESLAIHASGKQDCLLAVAGEDHHVAVWKLVMGADAKLYNELAPADGEHGLHTKRVPSMDFHPLKPWLATSGEDQKLYLWDLSRTPAALIWEQSGAHDTAVHGIAFNSGGDLLASGGGDYKVKIWSITAAAAGYDGVSKKPAQLNLEPLSVLKGHTDSVFAVAFSPDGNRIASAGYDRIIRVWDTTLRKPLPPKKQGDPPGYTYPTISTLAGHEGTILDLTFSEDNRLLTSGAKDETVRIWDVSEGRLLATVSPSRGVIRSVACRGFDSDIHCAGEKGWAVWSAKGGDVHTRLWNGGATIQAIAFDHTGDFIAAGGNDGKVRVWDKTFQSETLETNLDGEGINGVAFSPDGKWLAAAGEGFVVHIWEKGGTGWKKITPPSADVLKHDGAIWGLSFDPGGKWLISGNTDKNKRIRIWRTGEWSLVKESEELKDSVYTLACDPGGRFLIQGDSLGQVEIRDLQSLTVLKTTVNVKQGEANVWSVALCPEPLSILSGNSDGRVYRWTPGIANWGPGLAETKISIKDEDAALNHTINSVSYSPRHGWVAAGGDGGSVQIYDSDLKRLRSLPTDGSIWYVAFDSKGTRLAFGGTDRILRIIDVDKLIQLQSQSPDVLYSEACHTTGMSVLNGKIIPSTP